MMGKEISIEVKNLSKHFRLPTESSNSIKQIFINWTRGIKGYKEQRVLRNISFRVEKGDFFGIVGRNGSGKSTLLKLISGIYSPDSGSILINGSLVSFIELGVGFNAELTGRENIYLNGALMGFSVEEIDAMYDEIVEFAELGEFMDQKLKNYSSGMQVRLAFSCAIQAKSDILVLDEVLAVGDESFQRKCNDYFDTIRKEKDKTVILVTHSMEAVRLYCNKAILIDDGVLKKNDTDVNMVANEYSKLFIASEKSLSGDSEKRFGSGEIIFRNIKHKLDEKDLIIEFDIINQTDCVYEGGVDVGVDICLDGEIITGTQYLKQDRSGIELKKRQKKHFVFITKNLFGKYTYVVNMNLKTANGTNCCDCIQDAFSFTNYLGRTKYYKVLSDGKFKEEK